MSIFKPLLSKKERRTLNADEKAALKHERRAERKAAHPNRLRIDVDLAKLKKQAVPLLLEIAGDKIPGPDKMDEVLDILADKAGDRADDLMVWSWAGPMIGGPLEFIDGIAADFLIRAYLKPKLQKLYEEMKAEGDFR